MGVTWVRLKQNQAPSRSALDADLIPDAVVKCDRDQGSVHLSGRVEISNRFAGGTPGNLSLETELVVAFECVCLSVGLSRVR
jgi:hypothetical protein